MQFAPLHAKRCAEQDTAETTPRRGETTLAYTAVAGMSAQAEQFREQGNGAFKAGEFSEANGLYDSALALLSELDLATASDAEKEAIVKCRLNKAACLLKLQGYGAAGTQAREVLAIDPSNAKAHFRLGQVAEKIGDFSAATKALTEAIKLAPSLREPRELLESIKSRLKACPRLEQALQDMALVEERALRALNYADVKRARKQMELLLKDARANKETHWEARALLGLALVCQDEGECEGAQDYIDAARRRLEAADDRRAELYCLQTDALVCIDRGEHGVALPMLEGGKRLAEEMGEGGLAARFASNLALVHTQVGAGGGPVAPASLARSIAMGEEAVGLARSRGDSHFEAVARTNLAQAYRLSRRYEECAKTLKDALVIGETLGYAHLLAAALRQFALLCLEKGRSPSRVGLAIEKLERARKIASANGLRRAACDDAYNKWAACLRYSFGTRAEAIGGLEGALAECKELGYGACRVRVLSALGLAFLRHPNGGIGSWTTSRSDVENAEEHLDAALKLAPKDTAAYGEVSHEEDNTIGGGGRHTAARAHLGTRARTTVRARVRGQAHLRLGEAPFRASRSRHMRPTAGESPRTCR